MSTIQGKYVTCNIRPVGVSLALLEGIHIISIM